MVVQMFREERVTTSLYQLYQLSPAESNRREFDPS